jgi:hypothetical protein
MKQLFKLLQLGLQITDVNDIDTSEFANLSKGEWTAIKDMAVKQGVSAIVLDGINQLSLSGYNLPAEMKLEWIGEALQIEQRNRQQMAVMEEMAGKWKEKGLRVMVMKGQANGTMYPKPEHRSPGDVDCYLFNDKANDNKEAYKLGNDIARSAGAKLDESWYKHSVISYKGETFENHQFFVHTRDGKRGKQLEKELEEALKVDASLFKSLTSIAVMPPVQWTAMFLTYHACAHFVSEGLRLKQLVDWVMFLKAHQQDVDWEAFWGFCERNHLRVFAEAMNTIAERWFGVKCHTDSTENTEGFESPYAERIMKSALYDEDYVFNSGKSGWANRIHLVRNMFRYRWKYEEVYQTNVWKQLWWYATGFIFKTE